MTEKAKLDAIAWGKQKNALGLSWGSPRTFRATDDGAVDGTTIVSSSIGGAANDAFVGMLIEVIYAANGPSGEHGAPIRAKIVAFNSATDTLTIEALPWQVSDGDSFALLNPPHDYAAEDTGGSATVISDAGRTEGDDYWVGSAEQGGPYTSVIKATNIATSVQNLVTNFSGGDHTVADMGANGTIGDLFEFLQYPDVTGGPLKLSLPKVDREAMTGEYGMLRGVAAPRTVEGNLDLKVRGPGRSRAGLAAELDTPLGAICDVTAAPSDTTVDAGGAVDSIPTVEATAAVGEMYVTEEGDVFMVAAVDAGVITPSPNLRTAPAEGTTLRGLRVYTPATTLNYAMWVRQWYGLGVVEDLWGLVPRPSFSFERGQVGKATLSFMGTDGYRRHLDHAAAYIARSTRSKLPTVTPRHIGSCRACVDGVSHELRTMSVDLGIELQPHENLGSPNWMDGLDLTDSNPSGQIGVWLGSAGKELLRRYREGRPCTVMFQSGTVPGDPGVFALWAHEAELRSDEIDDQSGRRSVPMQWRVTHDPTRSSSLPRWALAIG